MQFSVILYGPQFVRDNPDAARRWMVAYLRGVRDYDNAIFKGLDKDEVVRLIMKQVTIRDASLFDRSQDRERIKGMEAGLGAGQQARRTPEHGRVAS